MPPPTFEETARILCEPSAHYSEFERAILLFGLQAAAISPKNANFALEAKLHAAMKLLQLMEIGLPESASMAERLALPEYSNIFERMLARDGGWRHISRAWGRAEFAEQIGLRWSEVRDAVRLVDFSYRFAELSNKTDQRKAGVTMARNVVSKVTKISDGTLRTRWREYGESAVFAYLLRKTGLRPAKLTSKKFVEKLLLQVKDLQRLRELFAGYRDVSKKLRPRGYKCDAIIVDGLSTSKLRLKLKPFSPKELDAMKNYSR